MTPILWVPDHYFYRVLQLWFMAKADQCDSKDNFQLDLAIEVIKFLIVRGQ